MREQLLPEGSAGAAARQSALLAILDAGPVAPGDWGFMSRQQRRKAEAGIDALIAALDAIQPDPDLEPTMAGFYMPGHVDECEPDVDNEETLGWSNTSSQVHLGPNTADGDITAPERHGAGFLRCGADDLEPSLGSYGSCSTASSADQRLWSLGDRQDFEQDVHDEPHDREDEGTFEPDLGSLEGMPDQRSWAAHSDQDDEPALGSPEIHHDQRRWGQGRGSRELDHDERCDLVSRGMGSYDRKARIRRVTEAMLRRKGPASDHYVGGDLVVIGPDLLRYSVGAL